MQILWKRPRMLTKVSIIAVILIALIILFHFFHLLMVVILAIIVVVAFVVPFLFCVTIVKYYFGFVGFEVEYLVNKVTLEKIINMTIANIVIYGATFVFIFILILAAYCDRASRRKKLRK